MSSAAADSLIALLEAEVGSDASALPALAEALRRGGRATEAEQRARESLDRSPANAEGRLVLGLILLDQGRVGEARQVLERGIGDAIPALESLAPAPEKEAPLDGLTDPELDRAFEDAETDRDQLIDADRVAEAALHRADSASLDEIAPSGKSPFATQTVADLLEQQGDSEGARQLRTSLGQGDGADPAAMASASGQESIATLERWLGNLRRPRA